MLWHLGKSEQCFGDNQRESEFTICPMQTVITALKWEWIAAATTVLGAVLLAAVRKSQCPPKDINKHSDTRLPWRRLSCCLGTSVECRPQHLVGAPYVPRKWSDCRPSSLLRHTMESRVVSAQVPQTQGVKVLPWSVGFNTCPYE